MRRAKKVVLMVSIAIMVLVIIAARGAHSIRYSTYEYYGQVLSVAEFLKLVEDDFPLHCIQLPNVETYLSGILSDYACFHTEEERDTYNREVLKPEWERIRNEHSSYEPMNDENGMLSSDHWALFANSGLAGHLVDVHNGTTCQSTSSGVWSFWKDGNPNDLTLFRHTNCTGTPSFTYSNWMWSCVWVWPIGCGGSMGARVP